MKLTVRTLLFLLCGVMLMSAVACDNTKPGTDPSTEKPTTEPAEESVTKDPDSGDQATTEQETTEEVTTEEPDVMIGETLDAAYAADFTVSKVFTSDMVVQRGEKLRVWGWAPESENGKKISGEFMGMFAETLIENG